MAALAVMAAGAQGQVVVNFDTASNWTAGSVALTSYGTDHTYQESSWLFTGGPALRQTTTAQDGFAGALGTYAWRLRDASVVWTATYTLALNANESFAAFGFDARRWDGTPSPAYSVEYSLNGGSSWTTASNIGTSGVLDNTAFGNSSDWSTFSQAISSSSGLAANQFIVRFSATGGERIMVDNFSYTVVPEPTAAMLLAGAGVMFWVSRRKRSVRSN